MKKSFSDYVEADSIRVQVMHGAEHKMEQIASVVSTFNKRTKGTDYDRMSADDRDRIAASYISNIERILKK